MLLLLTGGIGPCSSVFAFTKNHSRRNQKRQTILDSRHFRQPLPKQTVGRRQDFSFKTTRSTQPLVQMLLHPGTVEASLALLGSSVVGLQVDRWIPSGGILGTLLAAALVSNIKLVPSVHPVYDLCWNFFLPASLTLLLLGYKNSNAITTSNNNKPDAKASIPACIRRVAGPFVIATVGSLLGCWTSFHLFGKALFGSLENAKQVTGCLSASYIGGSVNCFATAKLIRAPPDLLASLATADLLTMALYFSILSATLEWNWLKSKFRLHNNNNAGDDTPATSNDDYEMTTTAATLDSNTSSKKGLDSSNNVVPLLGNKVLSSVPLLVLTWSIVRLANVVEGFLGRWIPGTACGVIAVLAPWVQSIVSSKSWWKPTAATPLADLCFFLFFASIGIGCGGGNHWRQSLVMGPACLVFSLWALLVHLIVVVVGSLPLQVELEDVWIASNAAIGGPATAAAFCNRMKNNSDGDKNQLLLQGRTMAATVWGVVGYAIGTTLGVAIYRAIGGGIAV
jgi:uncharacterized membrane protein